PGSWFSKSKTGTWKTMPKARNPCGNPGSGLCRLSGMDRHAYPSDLSDAEFARLRPYLPEPKGCGRPWVHPRRAILDAIFYVVRTGCQWRALPRELWERS